MYERALGEGSPWAPYFACLPPDAEPLPYLWPNERAAEWLEGTEVFARLVADAPMMREDHRRIMDVCREHEATLRAFFPDGVAPKTEGVLRGRIQKKRAESERSPSPSPSPSPRLRRRRTAPRGTARSSPPRRSSHPARFRWTRETVKVSSPSPISSTTAAAAANTCASRATTTTTATTTRAFRARTISRTSPTRRVSRRRWCVFAAKTGRRRWRSLTLWPRTRFPPDPLRKPLVPGPVTYDDELDDRAAVAGLDAGCDGYLTLTATRHAAVGEELFNTFGDHGNALLLHKYGFAEWENDAGGVTVSPEIAGELLGFDVFAEALAALDGDGEEDSDEDEGETDEATNASDEGEKKSVVAAANTSADGIPAGAAAARAAGWSGGLYEISRDGEPSRDLLMLFAVALADPDDPNACDPSTGVPPEHRRSGPRAASPSRRRGGDPRRDQSAGARPFPKEPSKAISKKRARRRDATETTSRRAGARAARRRRCYSGRKSEPCANAHSSGSWIHSEPNFEVASGTRSRTGTGTGTRWEKKRKKDEDSNGGDVPSKAKGGKRTREGVARGSAPLQDRRRKHRLPPEPRENRERGGVTSPRTGRGVGRKTGHPRSRRGIRIAAVFARA